MVHDTAELLRAEGPLPVYEHMPEDVAHLPVIVVGLPRLDESGINAVMVTTLDVVVLGRRLGDADAQAELLARADETLNVLGGTRGTKVGDDPQLLRCTAARPATYSVAGNDFPAYSFTVALDVTTC